MAEKYKKLVTYQIDYFCDECGELMEWAGITLTLYPAQYPHGCKNGHKKTFYRAYPSTSYEFERGLTKRALDAAHALKNWLVRLFTPRQ